MNRKRWQLINPKPDHYLGFPGPGNAGPDPAELRASGDPVSRGSATFGVGFPPQRSGFFVRLPGLSPKIPSALAPATPGQLKKPGKYPLNTPSNQSFQGCEPGLP
jgi:hypothetical protein